MATRRGFLDVVLYAWREWFASGLCVELRAAVEDWRREAWRMTSLRGRDEVQERARRGTAAVMRRAQLVHTYGAR
jgi:hypothetical protein